MKGCLAWLLLVVGGIWTLIGGAITAFWLYNSLLAHGSADPNTRQWAGLFTSITLMGGAIALGPGLLILVLGIFLARSANRDDRALVEQMTK